MSKTARIAAASHGDPTDLTKLTVDLATLAVPGPKVFANGCSIIDYGLYLELAFTQSRPKGSSRSVTSLMVPVEAVVGPIWRSAGQFFESEREKLLAAGIELHPVGTSAPEWGDAPIFLCNVVRLTRAGTETGMECYWLSPWALHQTRMGKRPVFDALIQIQLPAPVLIGLLEHFSRMLEDLRKRVVRLLPFVESSK